MILFFCQGMILHLLIMHAVVIILFSCYSLWYYKLRWISTLFFFNPARGWGPNWEPAQTRKDIQPAQVGKKPTHEKRGVSRVQILSSQVRIANWIGSGSQVRFSSGHLLNFSVWFDCFFNEKISGWNEWNVIVLILLSYLKMYSSFK